MKAILKKLQPAAMSDQEGEWWLKGFREGLMFSLALLFFVYSLLSVIEGK
jgi:hypothetical protein